MENKDIPTFKNWTEVDDIAYKECKYYLDDSPVACFIEWLDKKFPNGVIIDKDYEAIQKEEKLIPITLGMIHATCGWSRYCDVTGGNHYMLNEWSVEDTEIFKTKESHAIELGFIK
jgi:hypothetical protein